MGVLGEKEGKIVCKFYGVTPSGNFEEGRSIIHIPLPPNDFCEQEGIEGEKLLAILNAARRKLFEARAKRVRPGLDDKIITSWNGLMIGSLALAGRVLDAPQYLKAASAAADFILSKMRSERGLLRTHRNGESRLNAYLDDYAFLIFGLVDLYEAGFENRWLEEAGALSREMIDRFWDEDDEAFFFTSHDHEELVARKKMAQDSAIPSGNSMAAWGLLRLGMLTGEEEFSRKGAQVLRVFGLMLDRAPAAFHMMLAALEFQLDDPVQIAIVGDPSAEDTRAALRAVDSQFVPNKILALLRPSEDAEGLAAAPLLRGKTL